MLYEFLADNREQILAMTRKKVNVVADDKPTTPESERGLPQFYDHLTHELERESKGLPQVSEKNEGPDTTAKHGTELKRLGYTVSQVVQGYGALCQSITELASSSRSPIDAEEFRSLNLILDLAIAKAVTGFAERVGKVDCAKKMGFLAHELRNALSAALIAHSMVKKGVVGTGGSTNALLERNLNRMREILDRSFSEVRMQNEKDLDPCPLFLIDLVEEIEATAGEEARAKGRSLNVAVDPGTQLVTDAHFLTSALSNLVLNAIKYSKEGGSIWVRGRDDGASVVIEVEDQCGGLPKGKAEELFQPFTQKSADRTGLGLGLTISRQAVARCGGALTVRDLPGKGCVFVVTLPKQLVPESARLHGAKRRHISAKK
jgi:signal transduction histidine kinase